MKKICQSFAHLTNSLRLLLSRQHRDIGFLYEYFELHLDFKVHICNLKSHICNFRIILLVYFIFLTKFSRFHNRRRRPHFMVLKAADSTPDLDTNSLKTIVLSQALSRLLCIKLPFLDSFGKPWTLFRGRRGCSPTASSPAQHKCFKPKSG